MFRQVARGLRRRREEKAEEERLEAAWLKRIADDAAAEAQRLEKVRLEAEERERKAKAEEERTAQAAIPLDEPPAPKEEETEEFKTALAAEDDAKAAEERAKKAAKDASAKSADMERTRGTHGAVSSQRTRWIHDENNVDRAKLDLEKLRQHFNEDAVHKAIRSFIKAGGRKGDLAGADIYEHTDTVVR